MLVVKRKFSIHKKYSTCDIPHYKKCFDIIYQDWGSNLSRPNQWNDTRLEYKIEIIKSKGKKKELETLYQCYCVDPWEYSFTCMHALYSWRDNELSKNPFLATINIFKEIENNFTRGRKLLAISCCCIQSSGEQNIKLKIFSQAIHFTFARG